MVEFALVLPVLLLLTLIAVDFGRLFLGWVNLQQMTRIAANEAADHASAWGIPADTAEQDRYRAKIRNDARLTNCNSPTIDDPLFPQGPALGAPVTVRLNCYFSVITPIVSNMLGGSILVSAETTYAVKEGAVAVVPGGGAPIIPPPTVDFVGSPRSGWAPLTVKFTDLSAGAPTSWVWDFDTGRGGVGAGSVSPGTALTKGPQTVTYGCTGAPGDTCTFGVSLQAANAGGNPTLNRSTYVTVTVPPPLGPIAEFTATPLSGFAPLAVNFSFVNLRSLAYSNWEWDFTSDGIFDAVGQSASHSYGTEGQYDVTLRVTDNGGGGQSTLTKVAYVVVTRKICIVPDFANIRKNDAQARWNNSGFTTTVLFLNGNGNYAINTQTLVGGTIDPQPNGCGSTITVGP